MDVREYPNPSDTACLRISQTQLYTLSNTSDIITAGVFREYVRSELQIPTVQTFSKLYADLSRQDPRYVLIHGQTMISCWDDYLHC